MHYSLETCLAVDVDAPKVINHLSEMHGLVLHKYRRKTNVWLNKPVN